MTSKQIQKAVEAHQQDVTLLPVTLFSGIDAFSGERVIRVDDPYNATHWHHDVNYNQKQYFVTILPPKYHEWEKTDEYKRIMAA